MFCHSEQHEIFLFVIPGCDPESHNWTDCKGSFYSLPYSGRARVGSDYYFVIPGCDPESHNWTNCKGGFYSLPYSGRARVGSGQFFCHSGWIFGRAMCERMRTKPVRWRETMSFPTTRIIQMRPGIA